jgi:hypothetical protein
MMLERRPMHSNSKKQLVAVPAILFVMMASLAAIAQNAKPVDQPARAVDVVPVAPSTSLESLLPDKLAGLQATSGLRQVGRDNLSELVGDKAPFYQEYFVTSAVSRDYGRVHIEVFETQNQRAAFGLFTFSTGRDNKNPLVEDIGSGGFGLDGELVFFKGRFFVRVSDATHTSIRGGQRGYEAAGRALAAEIAPANPATTRPALLDSLPAASLVVHSQRYFLGPESLNAFVEHGREMFDFAGDTEAVAAEYERANQPQAGNQTTAGSLALKVVIVEYHTPQFATDAMRRAAAFISSLPENEQQQIILKRVGNYIVEAVNVRDRELAEGLINSVEYPYTVKWLRNPLWPTNDPFRVQKAAEMLVSTFGLLGLIIATVLTVGTVFGTTIFLKRRKRQQEVFSDAGGMLRLDIDQLETAMLGLPPGREE